MKINNGKRGKRVKRQDKRCKGENENSTQQGCQSPCIRAAGPQVRTHSVKQQQKLLLELVSNVNYAHLLSQTLWGRGPEICVSSGPPGNLDACSSLRTAVTENHEHGAGSLEQQFLYSFKEQLSSTNSVSGLV